MNKILLQGVLRVHVFEAKNLMRKDVTLLKKGKSDPYAVISVGTQEYKTKVIDDSIDPKWDYWCEVIVFFNMMHNFYIYLFSDVLQCLNLK